MLVGAHELRAVHAEFGTPDALISRRRATYSAALELVSPGETAAPSDALFDLLDSPVARSHLADVIRGTGTYSPDQVVTTRAITCEEFSVDGARVRVASGAEAQEALTGALDLLAKQ